MALNREWHQAHRMPKNATPAQRVRWHVAHARHCGCRAMPDSIKREIAASAKKTPATPPRRRKIKT
jgi:hypothetical protein